MSCRPDLECFTSTVQLVIRLPVIINRIGFNIGGINHSILPGLARRNIVKVKDIKLVGMLTCLDETIRCKVDYCNIVFGARQSICGIHVGPWHEVASGHYVAAYHPIIWIAYIIWIAAARSFTLGWNVKTRALTPSWMK